MNDSPPDAAVLLRPARPDDSAAISRVAQLDTRPVPPGPHLVAEREGRIEAAISLGTRELIANPFSRTADLCALLRLRVAELAAAAEPDAPIGDLRPRPLGATT